MAEYSIVKLPDDTYCIKKVNWLGWVSYESRSGSWWSNPSDIQSFCGTSLEQAKTNLKYYNKEFKELL